MKTWRITGGTVVILFFIFFLPACTCVKYEVEPGKSPGIDTRELFDYPDSFRLVHRIRLRIRKQSFDLIGYLAVKGECLRAVALTEIGGKVFDMLVRPGERRVIKHPRRLPVRSLKSGVMNELTVMFTPKGQVASPGITVRAICRGETGNEGQTAPGPVSLLLVRGGCVLAGIDIRSFRKVDGCPGPVPERFVVKNKRWGYTMQVELIRMDLRPVKEDVFKID